MGGREKTTVNRVFRNPDTMKLNPILPIPKEVTDELGVMLLPLLCVILCESDLTSSLFLLMLCTPKRTYMPYFQDKSLTECYHMIISCWFSAGDYSIHIHISGVSGQTWVLDTDDERWWPSSSLNKPLISPVSVTSSVSFHLLYFFHHRE